MFEKGHNEIFFSQQVKTKHQMHGCLFQEIHIATWEWEDINMDFVVGLPWSKKQYDSIWCIMDRLTKSAHFIPVKSNYST